jgi:hypothetical protein
MNGNIGRINESIGVSFAVSIPGTRVFGRRSTQARERARPFWKAAFFDGGVF